MDIEKKYNQFVNLITEYISEDRRKKLLDMYDIYGERLVLSPASSTDHYHNSFPGGYIDHVVRVAEFSLELYDLYCKCSLDVSDFTKENLVFAAINHDLGKLGFPEKNSERYLPEDNDWRRNKLGKIYKMNPNNPFSKVPDLSIFILQNFSIKMSWVEYLTIMIHDGIYEEANKPYFISGIKENKIRTNMPQILHQADMMASRLEYEIWNNAQKPEKIVKKQTKKVLSNSDSSDVLSTFKEMFS